MKIILSLNSLKEEFLSSSFKRLSDIAVLPFFEETINNFLNAFKLKTLINLRGIYEEKGEKVIDSQEMYLIKTFILTLEEREFKSILKTLSIKDPFIPQERISDLPLRFNYFLT